MSTATLLIVTARLRSIARPDGHARPVPSASLNGRSRATRGVVGLSTLISIFGRIGTGSWPFRRFMASRPVQPLACAGVRSPFVRAREFITASLFTLLAPVLPVGSASAQVDKLPVIELDTVEVVAEASPRIGGKAPQGPCVIVDIAGERAGHLDCATQRLTEAARIAQDQARAGIDAPVPQAGSPDVQLGVANQTATRLRMGNALGRSVHPERPASRPPRGARP